jgi:glycosyltransferase involved in cell wall biosynthesis
MYSVCIPFSCDPNKAKSLRLTIRSILAQSIKPSQIIISLNGHDYGEYKKQLCNWFPNVQVVLAIDKINNVSYARNTAAKLCTSEYIMFVDDDTLAGGVSSIKKIIDQASAFDFACGAKRLWSQSNWSASITEIDQISHITTVLSNISFEPLNINRKSGKQKLSNYSFIGNFGMVSKKIYEEIDGFDETFEGWGYEDADLIQKLLHNNARFLLLDAIGVKCYHLSHEADKSNIENNIDIYNEKIKLRGLKYNINHLFGVFENDGFSLTSSL